MNSSKPSKESLIHSAESLLSDLIRANEPDNFPLEFRKNCTITITTNEEQLQYAKEYILLWEILSLGESKDDVMGEYDKMWNAFLQLEDPLTRIKREDYILTADGETVLAPGKIHRTTWDMSKRAEVKKRARGTDDEL